MQISFDQTIFAWRGDYQSSGLLARSPTDFRETPELGLWHPVNLSPYAMTNVGLSLRLLKIPADEKNDMSTPLTVLQCDVKDGNTWKILFIHLKQLGDKDTKFFVNGKSCVMKWKPVEPAGKVQGVRWQNEHGLVLEDEHYELLKHSIEDTRRRWELEAGIGDMV
ncbi:hypothetical protein HYFRA_00004095 [Hymenoscyphus fraxineus]|uniref:Uncharacterized protein n=1 Tax=Hymenoscyphus fraxineus TaxID=746836 RepID=A0A9N9KPL9_9HELO|nr:hypothetical protein HYFRA_00004095 [Hymenoscyphus fraxineus]